MRTEIVGRQEIMGRDEILGDFVGRQEILGYDEILGDFVGLQEILGLDEIVGRDNRARRRARRRRHLQNLKTRAAAGDQQAIAKLQRMQNDLGLPAASASVATTTPATATSSTIPPLYLNPTSPTPPTYSAYTSTPATSAYQPSYQQQYAYQNPNYQSSYYNSNAQDPIDVYQGDVGHGPDFDDIFGLEEILGCAKSAGAFVGRDEILGSFVGDEERELARDGSRADRAALRRVSSSGYNGHWKFSRASGDDPTAALVAELKTRAAAGDLRALKALEKIRLKTASKTKVSGDATGSQVDRQAAKQILQGAAGSKKIARTDLKKAIWLYAGRQSTVEERTAVGSKMIAYLNKNKVQLV